MPARTGSLRELFSRIGLRRPVEDRTRCANCGITIDGDDEGPPSGGGSGAQLSAYCCDGCADGGPCVC